jgi:hypothetical protein
MTFFISVLMPASTSFAENAPAVLARNQPGKVKAAAATSLRAKRSNPWSTRKKNGLLRFARNDDKI